jgi:hypothetical protein
MDGAREECGTDTDGDYETRGWKVAVPDAPTKTRLRAVKDASLCTNGTCPNKRDRDDEKTGRLARYCTKCHLRKTSDNVTTRLNVVAKILTDPDERLAAVLHEKQKVDKAHVDALEYKASCAPLVELERATARRIEEEEAAAAADERTAFAHKHE